MKHDWPFIRTTAICMLAHANSLGKTDMGLGWNLLCPCITLVSCQLAHFEGTSHTAMSSRLDNANVSYRSWACFSLRIGLMQGNPFLGMDQVEQETAWAMDFSATAIVEEEEDLIPSNASEFEYVKVKHHCMATVISCTIWYTQQPNSVISLSLR